MESSTEVGKERGPLAPWSVRFGCLRREPRKTGQLGGAYRSSADDVVVASDSGSRLAALETALRLRNHQKSSRRFPRWKWRKKKSRRRNQRGRSGASVSTASAGLQQGAGAGWDIVRVLENGDEAMGSRTAMADGSAAASDAVPSQGCDSDAAIGTKQ